jgi:hypothetical protein
MDTKTSVQDVQDEFKAPCRQRFKNAVKAMKFLIKWHDEDALFDELRKVVNGEKELKNENSKS